MRATYLVLLCSLFLAAACGSVTRTGDPDGSVSIDAAAPGSCTDSIKNRDETDVDCGGPCGPCGDNRACEIADDCTSGVCNNQICSPPSCSDNTMNADETDVDCGGHCGDRSCAVGQACNGTNTLCETNLCSANVCVAPKRIFVSSSVHTGNMGGIDAADAICQNLANGANLGGTYKAWLSTSAASAAQRMRQAPVPYVTVTGTIVANDWADLTDGSLANPINRTETGGQPPASSGFCDPATTVWVHTGTRRDGSTYSAGYTCSNWTSTSGGAAWGEWTELGDSWTIACAGGTDLCKGSAPVYCLEQ